jgi:hypothetical protein
MEEELRNIIFIKRDFDYSPNAAREIPTGDFSISTVLINHNYRFNIINCSESPLASILNNQKNLLR